ncbi:MAG: SPOR domain-containing protein [Cyclobacteriaceae bacterium]|nr:SPOR domain-containing protein [Cyclobacteriaceae bacterium]
MYRAFICMAFLLYMSSCAKKTVPTKSPEDYVEDLSAYRPPLAVLEEEESTEKPVKEGIADKGSYVAPKHHINKEMNIVMDSIIAHNKMKQFQTFTIQVYTGRSREEANQVREKVYRTMPDEEPVLVYKQPSYKVNVGKYFDSVQAYKTLTILKESFPGAMLVPERGYLELSHE